MTELLSVLRIIGTLFVALLIFNFVILIHEWGHFLAARWRGLKVEKFQIWMGKPIWKRTWNGVQYGLGSIPIGGFVALPQMAPMEAIEGRNEEKAEQLPPVKPIDKIIVAFAGPLFSGLLALAFAFLVMWAGKPQHPSEVTTVIGYVKEDSPAAKSGLLTGDKILKIDGREVTGFGGGYGSVTWSIISSEQNPIDFLVERSGAAAPVEVKVDAPVGQGQEAEEWAQKSWWTQLVGRPPFRRVGIGPAVDYSVKKVLPNSPAELAGLKPGDRITGIDGKKILTAAPIFELAEKRENQPILLEVQRGGQTMNLTMVPAKPLPSADGKPLPEGLDKPQPGMELGLADEKTILVHPNPFKLVYGMASNTVSTLRGLLVPSSGVKLAYMSGPVGIMNLYYNILQGEHPILFLFYISVMLNIGLAIFNLLPLPVLDGGHITMGFLEMIRGKAASLRVMEVLQTACVLLLLGFVCFVTVKDIGGWSSGGPGKEPEIKFAPPSAVPAPN
ncbi:MAG: regulator of sigma protease [Verrucomicrobiales bacterium]|nr:regulator of sigma protease [Verrucomicrobiales bacterium]